MSGSLTFANLPRATQLRQAAVAVLQNAGTAAGARVFDTPLDALDPNGDYPCISVTTTTDRAGASNAGGAVQFKVTYNLHVACSVIAAVANDAIVGVEVLAQAARTALFSDPVFRKFFGPIASVDEKGAGGKNDARYIATMALDIASVAAVPGEVYAPIPATVLQPTGQPQAAPRQAITPLLEITGHVALPGQQPPDQTPVKTITLTP
jgi:hypothetical protein